MWQRPNRTILISGGGIAGLTLAILLNRYGFDTLIVEKAPALRTEGYMMDFFGTGWDVATQIGVEDAIRAVRYPIDGFEYVDREGRPFLRMPVSRLRDALRGKYAYLRRQDLERILFERAVVEGVRVRFATSIRSIDSRPDGVGVEFDDGSGGDFRLVVGAGGIRSRVRELAFGPYESFARHLGYYVGAFCAPVRENLGGSLKVHEEVDRLVGFYPTADDRMDATYLVRHPDIGLVPQPRAIELLKSKFKGSEWIAEEVLDDIGLDTPLFFDAVTQIVMPSWSRGRVVLVGDACGCLTLLAGQGSHMAMAGAYILANELRLRPAGYEDAFRAYERFFRPHVETKQREAARLARAFVPTDRSRLWFRRLVIKSMFSSIGIKLTMASFGARSVLTGYSARVARRGPPSRAPAKA